MAQLFTTRPSPGGPGAEATWAQGDKDGVGTARSDSSLVWFTIAQGIINEVYYPTIDTPQIRDLQLIVTDGASFFHDARHDLRHDLKLLQASAQAYELTSTAIGQPYKITQTIITNPDAPCLLVRCRLEAAPDLLPKLRVFALVAPHVNGHGGGNSGYVGNSLGKRILVAHRDATWLALDVDTGFARASCGFVGVNDGWTDIVGHRRLPVFDFDCAQGGNIALTGEIDLSKGTTFTLGLAFGETWPHDSNDPEHVLNPHNALAALIGTFSRSFDGPDGHLSRFLKSWAASPTIFRPKPKTTSDQDNLFRFSRQVLLSHEDKLSSGALVASMSIPWGEYNNDSDGGYHMVWPRDMSQSATALIAAGERDLPLRGLIFLAASQLPNGRFYQRFYINGDWNGRAQQLDEYSFPIVLAYRLKQRDLLDRFDPTPMVLRAAGAIIADGPMTEQERWEENEGYSPSTLAINIAALVCASTFAEDPSTAAFLLDYADWLETKLEEWTVTAKGSLHPHIKRHFIRILPTDKGSGNTKAPFCDEDPDTAPIRIGNIAKPDGYLARDIVDGGFLELVRYGVRSAIDPLIVDTIEVIDQELKDDLPQGPCWRRYSHDGYGQTEDGGPFAMNPPFLNNGIGRPWPILTGERGHYELAAGRDPSLCIKAMEGFAGPGGLLPEQVWNRTFTPQANARLKFGGPTGSAVPLAWAHAEYIKLVRSASDGVVFDRIDLVADRYLKPHAPSKLDVWSFNRRVQRVAKGKTIRVLNVEPFRLHWSLDDWATPNDDIAVSLPVGISFVDVPTQGSASTKLLFTFYWLVEQRWEKGPPFEIMLV